MYTTMAIMCLVFLIILFGNTLTIVAFIKFRTLRKVRNYFLVSLAVADILHGLVNMLSLLFIVVPEDYWKVSGARHGSSIAPTLFLITVILSYLHIFMITFDCFICIIKPLHHHQLLSPGRAKAIIAAFWAGSFLAGSVYLLKEMYVAEHKSTHHLQMYDTLMKIILWVIVVLAVIVMYVKIFAVIRKQKKAILELGAQSSRNAQNDERNTRSRDANKNKRVVMVFLIIVSFIVLWLPYVIITILYAFYRNILIYGLGPSAMVVIFVICVAISFTNSAVNAFIYARFDKEFRNAYVQILKCKTN